ncbi:hypothetical protein DI392_01050 [Vibrio albus]|uniref:GGDEF domain-containing protein n=1 Tax=Vibrio albus TaxID=2200953 RepID=A0A2U3BDQ2_9VIBR|nr:GGDEF domain-containing protein [Vibrio albus]PWI34897.1 hypothetical protein DI392_01050 [Vibrio albus]
MNYSDSSIYLVLFFLNLFISVSMFLVRSNSEKIDALVTSSVAFLALGIYFFMFTIGESIYINIFQHVFIGIYMTGIVVCSIQQGKSEVPVNKILLFMMVYFAVTINFMIMRSSEVVFFMDSLFLFLSTIFSGLTILYECKNRKYSKIILVTIMMVFPCFIIVKEIMIMTDYKFIFDKYTNLIWVFYCGLLPLLLTINSFEGLQKRLLDDSITDPLTHLYNRRIFDIKLNELSYVVTKKSIYGALIFIDLDKFKEVNDIYGHIIGDKVLRMVASRLKHISRKNEIPIRLGGDEFAILLEISTSSSDEAYNVSTKLAERIEKIIEQHLFIDGHELRISASIGIHIISPNEVNIENIVEMADSAMYRAKKNEAAHIQFSSGIGVVE